jgi:hypothetical protein
MTEQDKQALIKHFCSRDCGEAAEGCTIMPCHEIELIQEFPTTDTDSDTISRQAAIDALERDMASLDHIIKGMSANDVRLDAYVSQRNQVNYDIYTINNLPPAQPEQLGTNLAEVGTDCISRQAAIDRATKEHDFFRGAVTVSDKARRDELLNVMCWLGELPPAQPERIKGRWIEKPHVHGVAYCSLCDYELHTNDTNFCPNCGAEMREVTT